MRNHRQHDLIKNYQVDGVWSHQDTRANVFSTKVSKVESIQIPQSLWATMIGTESNPHAQSNVHNTERNLKENDRPHVFVGKSASAMRQYIWLYSHPIRLNYSQTVS